MTKRILICEDDESLLKLLSQILEMVGFEVIAAEDGQEGLNAYLEAPGSLSMVVTDIAMPKMSGTELAEQIRAKGFNHPIVAITGDESSIPQNLLDTEIVNTVIKKPLALPVFANQIKQILSSS